MDVYSKGYHINVKRKSVYNELEDELQGLYAGSLYLLVEMAMFE